MQERSIRLDLALVGVLVSETALLVISRLRERLRPRGIVRRSRCTLIELGITEAQLHVGLLVGESRLEIALLLKFLRTGVCGLVQLPCLESRLLVSQGGLLLELRVGLA